MNTKRLCSLGILDININLFLYESQILDMNLKLDTYNSNDDLLEIFEKLNSSLNSKNNKEYQNKEGKEKNIDYINYEKIIFLDSDNCLINTLLYINKSHKTKTFIEFIVPNKLEFNDKNKFLKNFIDEILSKNYLFIVETDKTNNIYSKINFVIKIVDDLYDTIKLTKKFEIFGNNNKSSDDSIYNLIKREDIEKLFLREFNYNFNKINFFIIDLKEIRRILIRSENIFNFLLKIINNFPKLKIILIIDENIITENKEKEELISIKKYIELCDIIFCFKNNMNEFLKFYYTLNKREITEKYPSKIFFLLKSVNNNSKEMDLITKDYNKFRKKIPRISIIFNEFEYVHIYEQDMKNKNLTYNNVFRTFITQEEMTEEKSNFIISQANTLYHIFISGFISRLVYNMPYDICFEAGNLLMKKVLNSLSKNEFNKRQEKFNIKVKSNGFRFYQKMKNDLEKEKKFVLDCTNKEKSKQKEYDILSDNNSLGYLTKRYCLKKYKNQTLLDKVNIILKGKRNRTISNINQKNKHNFLTINDKRDFNYKKIKNLLPFIDNNIMEKYKKAKSSINSYNDKNLKNYAYSRHTNLNLIKKSKHSKNILKNCLHNINKVENYEKFLFNIYFPNNNYKDFINNNNL